MVEVGPYVYHCLTIDSLMEVLKILGLDMDERICSDIWFHTVMIDIWFHTVKSSEITLACDYEELDTQTRYNGIRMGRDVSVQVYPKTTTFSEKFIEILNSNLFDNVATLQGVQELKDKFVFAYDYYPKCLLGFVFDLFCSDEHGVNISWPKEDKRLIHILREVVTCLGGLHSNHICHTKINPWNVRLTSSGMPKIMQFDRCKRLNLSQLDIVKFWLVKLIVFCFSKEPYLMVDKYKQKEKVSKTGLANMFDWAVEARDVACSLTFIPRDISIPEVLLHPVPWDAWKWSHFIQDAHHFLKHYTEVDTTLDSKILKASYFYGDKWVDLLPSPVVQCMLRKDKNGKAPFYDWKHPLHLLRFVRNALVHR